MFHETRTVRKRARSREHTISTEKQSKKRTQTERSAASTEAMLNAAVELVAEHGSGVSFMKIGERAGFSHGLIMSRFRSKTGLIQAVIRRTQEGFVREIDSRSKRQSGINSIVAIAEVFARRPDQLSAASKAFYVLLGEAMGPDEDIRREFSRIDHMFRNYVGEYLKTAIENGEVEPDLPVEAMSFILVGLFRGAMMQQITNPSAVKHNVLKKQLRASVLQLLGAPDDA